MIKADDHKLSWFTFGILLVFSLIIASLFLSNIHRWSNEPEFGFFHRSATGLHMVAGVREPGRRAGLQPGDRILAVNGKPFSTKNQLRENRKYQIGESNRYRVERSRSQFDIVIKNVPLGFSEAFRQFGFTYLVGLAYVLIGIMVFLMKPHNPKSRAFFIFGTSFGLLVMFIFKGSTWNPSWMGTLHILFYTVSPAAFIHMAINIPTRWGMIEKHPLIQYIPYAFSLALFISIWLVATEAADIPRRRFLTLGAYFAASVMFFLFSCFVAWLRSLSEIVKIRAKCILMGVFISTSIPMFDFILSTFFRAHIVPGFNYYLPFLVFFPLCIAYSTVKHNLFDIQKAVRKTFGYILTTISVAFLYTTLVFVPMAVFGKKGISEYPTIVVGAMVGIIFIFSFFRQRVQRVVDRVFYRMEYNYREIMEKIGKSMRVSMSLEQIVRRMMDTVLHSMFIDSGYVLLKTKDGGSFISVLHKEPSVLIPTQDPLIRAVAERKKGITRYDIEEDPVLQKDKAFFEETFQRLEAVLILPIFFEERLFGFLVLGEKKSGRFYQREDILLLTFLVDQAAVGMENVRLQQAHVEALEKSKSELEALNKAKSKTLHLLSHELKTPLSVISGTVRTLKRTSEIEEDPKKREKAFRRLETHLNRLYDIQDATEKIVRSHQEVEHIVTRQGDADSLPESEERIELYPFAQSLVATAREKALHRELSFELQGPGNLSVKVHRSILEDVVGSLLRNAVENTPDEGLVRILWEKRDERVLLNVRDFGVGITAENQKHLGDAFFSTRDSDQYTTRKPYDFNAGGRGLTLYRIKSYAEQFGFEFSITSERCTYLPTDRDLCPGSISICPHCKEREDCLTSGGSTFRLAFNAA